MLHVGFWQELGVDLDDQEVHDMIREAISNYEDRIYYDGFVKLLIPQQ